MTLGNAFNLHMPHILPLELRRASFLKLCCEEIFFTSKLLGPRQYCKVEHWICTWLTQVRFPAPHMSLSRNDSYIQSQEWTFEFLCVWPKYKTKANKNKSKIWASFANSNCVVIGDLFVFLWFTGYKKTACINMLSGRTQHPDRVLRVNQDYKFLNRPWSLPCSLVHVV